MRCGSPFFESGNNTKPNFYQPLYARARNKEDNTMKHKEHDMYQEYADEIAIEHGDYYNTERFRKHLENSPVFEIVDKLSEYEDKLLKQALEELKTRKNGKI